MAGFIKDSTVIKGGEGRLGGAAGGGGVSGKGEESESSCSQTNPGQESWLGSC